MLTPGTRLGPYDIQSVIGIGGMGEVYKARDTRLNRTVAIKLLSGSPEQVSGLRERIEREARAVSQLNHPHICTLYDIGEEHASTGGAPLSYLVMEFVDGESLAERIGRGPLPLDRALLYAGQIADALDKAHRTGIIHGDLKPGNVMVTKGGVKLLDFGLARPRTHGQPAPGWADAATQSAQVVAPDSPAGTLQYMAPEQLEGRASDERADIFACGAVLYEMLTGRRAFDGDSQASVIAAILERAPAAPSTLVAGVPAAIDHVVATCLAKDPDERWQNAGDLTRELRWLASAAPVAVTAGQNGKVATTGWLRVWQVAAAVLLVVAAALSVVVLRTTAREETASVRTSILLPEGIRFPSTGTTGGVGRMALSPDGRLLVVVGTDPNGNQMLWLRPLEAATAVTIPGTEGAGSPFWSPDSRFIAFVAQGQLKTVDTMGGMPVVVASPAFNATGAWSTNNDILYTPTGSSPLSVIPASGGEPRPVTSLESAQGDQVHRNPAFLPDGQHFLYVAVGGPNGNGGPQRALYVGSLGGGAPQQVLAGVSGARFSNGHLLFLRETSILAQPFDADRLALTGESRTLAEQVDISGPLTASFTVSDTGLLAYAPASQGGSQLVWFDRQGRQLGTVGDAADYGDVELSPDGRLAAVSVLDPATNTRDLWVVDVARGVRTRFTFDRSEDLAPIWSRDGSRIIFTSNRSGHFDLYEKAASGIGAETRVFTDQGEKYPTSWLSDAATLLYWTFNPDGTELRLLSMDGSPRSMPFLSSPVSPGRFSPDGRYVLYYSTESGRSEVYLVPYPTPTRKWQVSSAGGNFARWRADGREVFHIGRDNKVVATTVNLENERVEIGQPTPLFEARPVGPRYFYDVTPDGQRFLVNVVRGASAVTTVTLVQGWDRTATP